MTTEHKIFSTKKKLDYLVMQQTIVNLKHEPYFVVVVVVVYIEIPEF